MCNIKLDEDDKDTMPIKEQCYYCIGDPENAQSFINKFKSLGVEITNNSTCDKKDIIYFAEQRGNKVVCALAMIDSYAANIVEHYYKKISII